MNDPKLLFINAIFMRVFSSLVRREVNYALFHGNVKKCNTEKEIGIFICEFSSSLCQNPRLRIEIKVAKKKATSLSEIENEKSMSLIFLILLSSFFFHYT